MLNYNKAELGFFCSGCGKKIETLPFITISVFTCLVPHEGTPTKARWPMHLDCGGQLAGELVADVQKRRRELARGDKGKWN